MRTKLYMGQKVEGDREGIKKIVNNFLFRNRVKKSLTLILGGGGASDAPPVVFLYLTP